MYLTEKKNPDYASRYTSGEAPMMPNFRYSRKSFIALAASLLVIGTAYAAEPNNVSMAANNPAGVVVQGGLKKISIAPGTYVVGTGWTITGVEVFVVPQAGGAAGENAPASYVQGGVWGGTAQGNPANMLFSNGGNGYPVGKYNVYAKGTFTKGASTQNIFSATVEVEVK